MEYRKIDPNQPDPVIVAEAAEILRGGGLVAYPTETFYGLGANPFDLAACRQVSLLKNRDPARAFPLILAGPEQLDLLCDTVPRNLSLLAERFWPGPLTVVVAAREKLPGALFGQRTVAVRVSAMVIARSLARQAGFPLVATSANLSGRSPAQTARDVQVAFGAGVDLILDGGTTPGGRASTIVDISGAEPRLLREGPVDFDEVVTVLGVETLGRQSLDGPSEGKLK